jgi:protein SCO1
MAGGDLQDEVEGAKPVRLSETQFAAQVDELATGTQAAELLRLLDERNAVYAERGAAAVVRMRGWVLGALARTSLPESGLLYVLEELDNGRDAYLVAAAARALRTIAPSPRFTSYLLKALANVRFHDDALSFEQYGGYAVDDAATTAFRETLETIAWLGASGRSAASSLRELLPELGKADAEAVMRVLQVLESSAVTTESEHDCCGGGGVAFLRELSAFKSWAASERNTATGLSRVLFEDQAGKSVSYEAFFLGRPSIVVFFYTRCDNPEKCSLTLHKLGNVVRLLGERGLAARIRTAAISYDPGWDVPDRLTGYAKNRDLPFDDEHRVLRTLEGEKELREHFELGVNFVESLVNRHRVELYILDECGRIAASFARLQWDETSVVEQAAALLREVEPEPPSNGVGTRPLPHAVPQSGAKGAFQAMTGLGLAFVTAFFPKCPMCWAAYLSWFGVAGLDSLPRWSPWMLPGVVALMALNLASVCRRSVAAGSRLPILLSAAGALTVVAFGVALRSPFGAKLGLGLSGLGALASVFGAVRFSADRARVAH